MAARGGGPEETGRSHVVVVGVSARYQRAPEGSSWGSRAFEGGRRWPRLLRGLRGGGREEGTGDGDVTEKPRPGRCGAVKIIN